MATANSIRRELQELTTLLVTHNINNLVDLSPLVNAANNWQDGNKFNIDNLTFKFSASSQSPIPKVDSISVSVSLNYEYSDDTVNHDVFKIIKWIYA